MGPIFDRNRIILCHFDSYSALLLFARFGRTILMPGPAPEGSVPTQPGQPSDAFTPEAVRSALSERYGLETGELTPIPQFEEWLQADDGLVRVHLLRLKCFAPPRELIAQHDGAWKPVSELRGIPPHELGYARRVFDIIMNG